MKTKSQNFGHSNSDRRADSRQGRFNHVGHSPKDDAKPYGRKYSGENSSSDEKQPHSFANQHRDGGHFSRKGKADNFSRHEDDRPNFRRSRDNEDDRPNFRRSRDHEDDRRNKRSESSFRRDGATDAGRSRRGDRFDKRDGSKYRKPNSRPSLVDDVDDFTEQPVSCHVNDRQKEVRLNKYIAHAGICSRRDADVLIAAGSVTVNGVVVTEMGYKVKPGDEVAYGGETLRSEPKRYFLLNKPKGFITTLDDPHERKTVMMLIDGACQERIYPVGRLDRATTGLLLFTNDGDMAKKLTHPSSRVYKVYQVELDRAVSREDMNKMLEGIELEDGMIKVDEVQYVEGMNDKRIVGVQLHSGKNRIVRRIFESLGYNIHKLDRVVFAGLTKKDLPRGRYRELTTKEVSFLKMI